MDLSPVSMSSVPSPDIVKFPPPMKIPTPLPSFDILIMLLSPTRNCFTSPTSLA